MAATKSKQESPPPRGILGVVRDKSSGLGLAGYHVEAVARSRGQKERTLGSAVTNADGAFRLLLAGAGGGPRRRPSVRAEIRLSIRNRFGVEVDSIRIPRPAKPGEPLSIEIDGTRPDLDRPAGPPVINPFTVLRNAYPVELEALARTGIRDKAGLLALEARDLAARSGLPIERVESVQLHADLAHAPGFTGEIAGVLVASGIKTREQLASARPTDLVRSVESARKKGLITARRPLRPSTIYGWVGHAKGLDPTPFSGALNLKRVLTDAKRVTDRVKELNPRASIIEIAGLLNPFNRLQAMARVRALMEAAGVYDLSSLGTFRVRGRRVLHPGYYVASRFDFPGRFEVTVSLSTLVARKAGFARLKGVEALEDSIHIIPNPVTDAVVIGSLVQFIEDGKLVIGKDVTSLVVITEQILYSELNEISYEDGERVPMPRAPMVPDRAATGVPRNDRNVYSPDGNNRGRNGGPGSPGATGGAGFDGNTLGPAPDVEIYVQRTPQGLPSIRIGGRRGGTGQPGQHGGHGSDGARGREACSGACYCHRGVGRGGDGGPGGPGGTGGIGGGGGSGGDLLIGTLPENIAPLTTMRPLFVDITGGPGGNGGDAGVGGEGGRGGAPGDDSWPWCDEEPSRVGQDGPRGPNAGRGADGGRGSDGSFTLQPITLSDWNALFNQPWIVRLEPWFGAAGSSLHVVAKNITSDTVVRFDGSAITPTAVDVAGATLDFPIPLAASGGLHNVQLSLSGATGTLFSNTVSFRVLPQLTSLAPDNGVPGTIITLRGRGFANGAQVRFGGTTLPAVFQSGEELRLTLPDHENIGLPAGTQTVQVVNPDGRESETLNFELTLDIVVRVKAWRVFPDIWVGGGGGFGGPGPGRDEDDIRDMFTGSENAAQVWNGHRILLQFDPDVGIAVVAADWAESWPIDNVTRSENSDVVKATDASGNFLHFEDGAVNYYFVEDIDDWTTHAYTYRGSETERQEFIIFEDTESLTDWEDAHVAAHEVGHVFALPHVCDDNPTGTTFGRTCSQGSDPDFLMYPSTNFWTDEGNTLTVEEARLARRAARLWHNR